MKHRGISSVCTVLSASFVLGAVLAVVSPQQTARPFPPQAKELGKHEGPAALVTLMGADSGVVEPWFTRCDNAEDWAALWEKHAAGSQMPSINFERCTVVGLFLGKKHNSKGVIVVSVEAKDGECLLRFDEQTYQTLGGATSCKPFGIVVLPKSDLPIVVEENVQNLKDNPPKWKERARLAR